MSRVATLSYTCGDQILICKRFFYLQNKMFSMLETEMVTHWQPDEQFQCRNLSRKLYLPSRSVLHLDFYNVSEFKFKNRLCQILNQN